MGISIRLSGVGKEKIEQLVGLSPAASLCEVSRKLCSQTDEEADWGDASRCLLSRAYPPFEDFVLSALPYAELSGGRYRQSDVNRLARGALTGPIADALATLKKSEAAVAEQLRRGPATDGVWDAISDIWRSYMRARKDCTEWAVVQAMKVTCDALEVYRSDPAAARSIDYLDLNAPLPVVGARLYSYLEPLLQDAVYLKKQITASFISDFGDTIKAPRVYVGKEEKFLSQFISKARQYEESAGKAGTVNKLAEDNEAIKRVMRELAALGF